MDVFTIQIGWIGGNPPPVTPPAQEVQKSQIAGERHPIVPIGLMVQARKRKEEEEVALLK